MKVYSPTGYSYVHVAEIAKSEIDKIDFALCKQPKETLSAFYNRQTRKPDLVTNAGFFALSTGETIFNCICDGKTVSYNNLHQWGMGITGNNEIQYGNLSAQNWRCFISGYPNLIDHGQKVSTDYANELNYKARRTMIGYNDKNIYVVCVESPGMAFNQMQDFMLSLGCKFAINLDGGGSTRMHYKGDVVTKGVENRAVDTVLAVYIKESVVEKPITNTTQGSVQTMSTYLKPDKIIKETISGKTITISQKIIPDGARATKYVCSYVPQGGLVKPNAKVNNGSGNPRGITVHNTNTIKVSSQTTMAEQYTRATYPNLNMSGAIVHYFVSGYNDIWQMLNTEPGKTERGWHASDGNSRRKAHNGAKYSEIGGNLDTISIECIGDSKEAEDATALLVAYLCKKHGLNPKADVYTHNYFMGLPDKIVSGASKNCPIYILPHWTKFIETVHKYYNPSASSSTSTSASPFKIGDTVEFDGTTHYKTANALLGFKCKPGKAQIQKIYQLGKSRHPYNLKYISGGGSTVNGWVDADAVSKVDASSKFTPYTASVTADVLNVRAGAGASYKIVTTVKKGQIYTIVEEKNGFGKLKSGAGWVSLQYIKKMKTTQSCGLC